MYLSIASRIAYECKNVCDIWVFLILDRPTDVKFISYRHELSERSQLLSIYSSHTLNGFYSFDSEFLKQYKMEWPSEGECCWYKPPCEHWAAMTLDAFVTKLQFRHKMALRVHWILTYTVFYIEMSSLWEWHGSWCLRKKFFLDKNVKFQMFKLTSLLRPLIFFALYAFAVHPLTFVHPWMCLAHFVIL